MDLIEDDYVRVRGILETFFQPPGTQFIDNTLDACTRDLIELSGHDRRTRAAARPIGTNNELTTPEKIAAAVLTAAAEHDNAQPFGFTDEEGIAHASVPVPLIEGLVRLLQGAENIMRAAHKHFNRPEQANVRSHRAQCETLRGQLENYVSPSWAFHQNGKEDTK